MRTPQDIRKDISGLRIANANEAETRHKLIDEILYDVLEWTKDDIEVETRVSEDSRSVYIDYLIRIARTTLLIEAKRVGANFESLPNTRKAPLKGTWLRGEISSAIKQARDYGRQKNVAFGIVTNGDAWIVFPINRRDAVAFEESFCLIFPNAESALETDIDEFRSVISRKSVVDGSLEAILLGRSDDQLERRRLNQIYDATFSRKPRTSIYAHIESAISAAFTEELIAENAELLEKAYVATPDRVRFDERIRMYVQKRDPVIATSPMKPLSKGGMIEITKTVTESKLSVRPIALLTLGLVGSGKTTFLNYVRNVSAKSFFEYRGGESGGHWVYVDFRNYSPEVSARKFILDTVFDYVTNHPFLQDYDKCIKYAYGPEINNFENGIFRILNGDKTAKDRHIFEYIMADMKAREPYASKLITYAAHNRPVFLVIDNLDQIEDVDAQARIFLDALTLSRTWRSNLIIAMRDSTYLRNRNSPIFDAFDFDKIYIEPPEIRSVLSKRFTIAGLMLKDKLIEFETDKGIRISFSDGKRVVDFLASGILGTRVGRFIEVAATGDTRLALQMTRQFLQYGYSSSTRAMEKFHRTGSYNLPVHEAIRAIMFGNQQIYNDDFSTIGNPFDAKLSRSDAQFLRIYILNVLVSSAKDRSFIGIDARDIIHNLEKIGFSERITEAVLKGMIAKRFCYSRSHQDFSRESTIIPSRFGGYVIRELIAQFVFIENALFDTFISDDLAWTKINDLVKSIYSERDQMKKFKLRKEAASTFFEFAEKSVEHIVDQARRRGLPSVWCANPIMLARSDFNRELERALRSAFQRFNPETLGR